MFLLPLFNEKLGPLRLLREPLTCPLRQRSLHLFYLKNNWCLSAPRGVGRVGNKQHLLLSLSMKDRGGYNKDVKWKISDTDS